MSEGGKRMVHVRVVRAGPDGAAGRAGDLKEGS